MRTQHDVVEHTQHNVVAQAILANIRDPVKSKPQYNLIASEIEYAVIMAGPVGFAVRKITDMASKRATRKIVKEGATGDAAKGILKTAISNAGKKISKVAGKLNPMQLKTLLKKSSKNMKDKVVSQKDMSKAFKKAGKETKKASKATQEKITKQHNLRVPKEKLSKRIKDKLTVENAKKAGKAVALEVGMGVGLDTALSGPGGGGSSLRDDVPSKESSPQSKSSKAQPKPQPKPKTPSKSKPVSKPKRKIETGRKGGKYYKTDSGKRVYIDK